MNVKLQLALDLIDLKKAHYIIKKTINYIDIIELGTPLIKAKGASILADFKKYKKPIVLDFKTADVGGFEAEIAVLNKADYSTVLGFSNNKTIKDFIDVCRKANIKSIVDLISVSNKEKRIEELYNYHPDYFLIHTGIDEQAQGINFHKLIDKVSNIPLIIGGGMNCEKISKIKNKYIEIIIVGSAITKAENPFEIAKNIKNTIDKTFNE